MRVRVDLFLDIPGNAWRRLSKQRIRARDIRFEGARWEAASFHCKKHGMWRGAMQVRLEVSPRGGHG
jgi:hypothetical protein